MKNRSLVSALTSALVLAMGVSLFGCGGGSGGGGSATVVLSGTAAAGRFSGADVKVYDASIGETGTPLATDVTDSNGNYEVTLPAGFDGPVLVVVSAKSGSRTQDEVFGDVEISDTTFKMRSVVPADAYANGTLTGHVTPYTNLMHEIVRNKIGEDDIDAAIRQARNVVMQFTGNINPLTVNPVSDPGMVVRLAAVSHMGNTAASCAAATTHAERIACSVNKLKTVITPMAVDDSTSGSLAIAIDPVVVAELKTATDDLDTDLVAENTGLEAGDLIAEQTETSSKFEEIAQLDELTAPSSSVASGIAQAKEFFANLREGILPYFTDDATGFLDGESDGVNAEFGDLSLASVNGVEAVANVVAWVDELLDGVLPQECTTPFPTTTCTWDSDGGQFQINLSQNTTTKKVTWTVSGFPGLTGTVDYTNTSFTVNGFVPPMSNDAGAVKAKVGNPGGTDSLAAPLVMTRATTSVADVYKYGIEGSIKDLTNCDVNGQNCTATLKLVFEEGSYINVHEPANEDDFDETKTSFDFTGTFITANYRFSGRFELDDVQVKDMTFGQGQNTWTEEEIVGGTVGFTGTINGTGLTNIDANTANDFDLMVGKIVGSIDGSDYNPNLDDSSSNFLEGALTFTGTFFKSATDDGLKLVVSMTGTGWNSGSMTVSYNDFNQGISLTGTSTYDNSVGNTETQYLTLSDANGISVKFSDDNSATEVMKDAVIVAHISGNRVDYMDDTFESLL